MIGVLVLAAGVPRMFASIERGGRLDNSVMALGYVIMRVALVFQWLRAANDNRARRRVCLTYAATISIAQVGWVVPVGVFLGLMYALSYYLVRRVYAFPAWLLIATGGAVAATLVAALSGVDVARCLVILMLAPAVTVVGSEVRVARTPSP